MPPYPRCVNVRVAYGTCVRRTHKRVACRQFVGTITFARASLGKHRPVLPALGRDTKVAWQLYTAVLMSVPSAVTRSLRAVPTSRLHLDAGSKVCGSRARTREDLAVMALPAVADLFKASFEDPLKKLLQPIGVVPGLVLVGLNLLLIYPTLVAEKVAFATGFQALDGPWQLGVVGIGAVLVGYLIQAFGGPILNIATGEAWRSSVFRERLISWQVRRFNAMRLRIEPAGPAARDRDYEVRTHFPHRDEFGPTSFGNVLSAISDRIFDTYGAELTATWTQMRQAVRKENADFLAEIDDDLAGFQSLLNVAAVLVVFAIEGLVVALVLNSGSFWLPATASLILAYVAYRGAVARLVSWGDQVTAAYDLYRPKLRELLGMGKPLSAEFEKRQFEALSLALLWNDPDRSYTADETPPVTTVSSASLSVEVLSSDAAAPITSQLSNGVTVKWVFDYLLSIGSTAKDETTATGVIEVTDRRLPRRISRAPLFSSGARHDAAPSVRRRSDVGLRDTIVWTITAPGGMPFVLGYRLEWVVSVDVRDTPGAADVFISEGATDLRGLVGLLIQVATDKQGRSVLALRDDRIGSQTRLTARYVGVLNAQLGVRPSDGEWTISGDLPTGTGHIEVRRDDD
jgi:hypothetical protein